MRLGSAVLEVWERDWGLQYWRPGKETKVCSTGGLGTRLESAVLETWE